MRRKRLAIALRLYNLWLSSTVYTNLLYRAVRALGKAKNGNGSLNRLLDVCVNVVLHSRAVRQSTQRQLCETPTSNSNALHRYPTQAVHLESHNGTDPLLHYNVRNLRIPSWWVTLADDHRTDSLLLCLSQICSGITSVRYSTCYSLSGHEFGCYYLYYNTKIRKYSIPWLASGLARFRVVGVCPTLFMQVRKCTLWCTVSLLKSIQYSICFAKWRCRYKAAGTARRGSPGWNYFEARALDNGQPSTSCLLLQFRLFLLRAHSPCSSIPRLCNTPNLDPSPPCLQEFSVLNNALSLVYQQTKRTED